MTDVPRNGVFRLTGKGLKKEPSKIHFWRAAATYFHLSTTAGYYCMLWKRNLCMVRSIKSLLPSCQGLNSCYKIAEAYKTT